MNKHRANATSSSLRTFERQAHFSPYLLRIYALNEYFLRTAKAMKLTSEDFAALIEEMKQRRPSEVTPTTGA